MQRYRPTIQEAKRQNEYEIILTLKELFRIRKTLTAQLTYFPSSFNELGELT